MIRGTSQQFKFYLPYTKSQLSTVKITFKQPENDGTQDCPLPIVKVLADCIGDSDSKEITVTLGQVETLAFSTDRKAWVQFRGVTTDGFAFASKLMPITVYQVLDEEVLQ